MCFAVVTGEASIICSSLVFKCLMCWSEAQHNSGISKHTQTHTRQTVSCVLRRILPRAGPSCPRPRCGLAPDVPASIISWWTNRLLACLREDVQRLSGSFFWFRSDKRSYISTHLWSCKMTCKTGLLPSCNALFTVYKVQFSNKTINLACVSTKHTFHY